MISKVVLAPFQFQKYGMLDGKVRQVSADATEAPSANRRSDALTGRDRPMGPLAYRTVVDQPAAARETRESLSGLELAPDFAALVLAGVDVHVSVAGFERLQLRGSEFGSGGRDVGVAVLGERHDHRAVLALRALVDVRRRAGHAGGGDAAAHGAVRADAEAAAAGTRGGYRRDFIGAAERHARRAAARHPVGHHVLNV